MMVFVGLEAQLSTQEERFAVLEQTTSALRNDFLQAIVENTRSISTLNKVMLQQAQNVQEANQELTLLTGVVTSQGQDLKKIKSRLDNFDQRFTSLEEKLDQVLQLFTPPPKPQPRKERSFFDRAMGYFPDETDDQK